MAETMGDRIREARIACRMSQEEAALEADMSRATWSRLENDGTNGPRLSTLMRVAVTLRMPLEKLLSGDGRRAPR